MGSLTRIATLCLLCVVASGCERPKLNTGGECTFNSDCADPLVCRLERCRRQCVDSRDCGAGLLCLSIGDMGGACQLDDEVECNLTSDCTEGLECRFHTCTTACVEDRDCSAGAVCMMDEDGMAACTDPSRELCIWDSDCPEPYICAADQSCQLECRDHRDCQAPRMCVESLCQLVDGGAP